MKLRLVGDPFEVRVFLDAYDYGPEPTEAQLALAVKVAVRHHDAVVGYVWAFWHDESAETLDFHACVAPEARLGWLSDALWDDLMKLAEFLGARRLRCQPLPDVAAGITAYLTRRFGFEAREDGSLNKEI